MRAILLVILVMIATRHTMTLLQQHHYYYDRYLRYIKKQKILFLEMVTLCSIVLLLFSYEIQEQCFDLALMIMISNMIQYSCIKKYRKPLVYTNRMKRLWVVHMISMMLFIYFYLLNEITIQILLLPLFYIMNYFYVVLDVIILQPIEIMIKEKIKKQAKQKIKDHTKVIMIGGSYGKTSIKNIVYELIKDDYYTHKSAYSYNNEMGISKYLLNDYDPNAQVFVCEVGVDHKGEMKKLCDFIHSDLVLLSAIGSQHLETFQTKDNIIKEKQVLVNDTSKIRVVNIDDVVLEGIKDVHSLITYGEQVSDYQIRNIQYANHKTYFDVLHQNTSYSFETSLLGKHHVANIVAGICIARLMGVDWEDLQMKVKWLPQITHRLELKKMSDYYLLDDAYNANEKGIRNALEVLKNMGNQRIVICSGLVEIKNSEKEHYDIGKEMSRCVDVAILIGTYAENMKQGLIDGCFDEEKIYIVKDIYEANNILKQIKTKDCCVLIENDLTDIYM